MRLIGGNISDTPVKEIGDGSAFNVGGGASAPDLVEIGTIPVEGTAASNFDESLSHTTSGGSRACQKTTVKWSDNSFGCFWISGTSPYKLYYSHLTTNSDGSFAAVATKVDLSGDLTEANTTNGSGNRHIRSAISSVKLSASRVVINIMFAGNSSSLAYGKENVVYDKNGDSVTEHGTVFNHGTPTWNPAGEDAATATQALCVAAVNADQGIVFNNDNGTTTSIAAVPCHFTGTKTAGTLRNVTNATLSLQSGVAFSDNSTPAKIFTVLGGSGAGTRVVQEWDFTVGTTPQLAGSYASAYTGFRASPLSSDTSSDETQTDGSFNSGGGIGVTLINKNDIERGRFLGTLLAQSLSGPTDLGCHQLGFFAGVTTNGSILLDVGTMLTAGTHMGVRYDNSRMIEIDYDDETYWGRYIHQSATDGGAIFFIPFNFNWSTFQITRSVAADLPQKAADVTVPNSSRVRDVLLGSSSAENFCVIYDEGGDDVRYLDVPFTK